MRPLRVRMAARRGFTLVEVLVVMSLLSLIMLAMGSALRTTAQTEERVDLKLQRADEMRVASDFLHSVLGRISMRKSAVAPAAGENPYIFSGAAQELSWIGIMPARYGVGGRFHFRLAVEGQPPNRALVLRFVPWTGADVAPDWARAETYPLVPDAVAMQLQYEDASVEPPGWSPQWTSPDRLPQRVLLSLQTESGTWPDLAFAMRVLPGSAAAGSGEAVFGGSR
jgi:general secretion pathway protein J